MKTKYIFCSFILLLLLSCGKKETIYKGQYQNQPVTVNMKSTPNFSSNTVDYYVQLGDLEPVTINAHTIDLYGRPYSYSIFKDIPYFMIEPDTITYKNRTGNNDIKTTMLYIDPKEHDVKSFTAYAGFFSKEWPQIQEKLRKLPNIYFDINLIGVAYTQNKDLIQYFEGEKNGKPYFFDITPDGVISFHEGTPEKNDFNLQGSGLAEKVEMPGNVINMIDTTFYNRSTLRQFKDSYGKNMEDYFTIKTKQ
ncbi:hypothetical protein [Chryseobacterium sp. ISL-6]|uniref:hypothetical protein n=1 Tax=Chryseobacterium sp. ISL-6 TaxID=2819143 RepID=UPI001BE9D347|nr:hypothetical protein [Chryseobacterium sp. ISL-6]MBT2623535.1 hypothetical protein [Chryseobacterium sp. ISL-6]